jgi:ribosomal protein S12 methylthiotransferase
MAGIEGVEWIRILYAYPSYFTDDLIAAIADIPQVCVCVCVCVCVA